MRIKHDSREAFHRSIYQCVKDGLLFEADGDTLIIHLTGGF